MELKQTTCGLPDHIRKACLNAETPFPLLQSVLDSLSADAGLRRWLVPLAMKLLSKPLDASVALSELSRDDDRNPLRLVDVLPWADQGFVTVEETMWLSMRSEALRAAAVAYGQFLLLPLERAAMAMSTGDLAEVETETLLSESLATPEGRRRIAERLDVACRALLPSGSLPALEVPTWNTEHRRRLFPLDLSPWLQTGARRQPQPTKVTKSLGDVAGRVWKVKPDRIGVDIFALFMLSLLHMLLLVAQIKSKMSDETDGKPDVDKAALAVNLRPLLAMVRALNPDVKRITVIVTLLSTHALDHAERSAWRAHEPPMSRSAARAKTATDDAPEVECHWVVLDCNDMRAGRSIFTDKMIAFAQARGLARFCPEEPLAVAAPAAAAPAAAAPAAAAPAPVPISRVAGTKRALDGAAEPGPKEARQD